MAELVSVIVPVYNVEEYVDKCLASIVTQSYNDLEILVVDDGATDSSGKKCDEWAKRDQRIKVIHQQNQGLSGARNTAIDVCTGDWITFVDSDDIVDAAYVATLLELAKAYGVTIAQCLSSEIIYRGMVAGNIEKGVLDSSAFLQSKKYMPMAWGKIYRREIFETERYPYGKIHEDIALTYKLIYSAGKVAYTSEVLYFCSARPDSINAKGRFYLQRLDILQFYKEQLIFYREKKEQELAERALRDYAFELLGCYDKTIRILKRPDIAKKIKKEYQQIWKELKYDRDISGKTKFLLRICCHFPTLWSRMMEK